MRAGLFLRGLARSHEIHVLVVPVFRRVAPPGPLVARCAAEYRVLELEQEPQQMADLVARAATATGRARLQALHPRPAPARAATVASAKAVADAAEDCAGVHVMRLYLAPFLDDLLDSPRRPRLVLDLDEVDSEVWLQFSGGRPQEMARYRRLEDYYLRLCDLVITAAPEDASMLRARHPGITVAHVPNAVPVPAVESVRGDTPAQAADLLFVGNLSSSPNVEAAKWLVGEVVPLLADGITVNLIGSRPTPDVQALSSRPGVTVIADVPAMSPWYARARIAVAPLLSGGGTRIKVIEALANGRPVVATSSGARGLKISDGASPVLVADTPRAFAYACRRLLEDPEMASRLGEQGRAWISDSLSIERVAERIDALEREVIGSR